MEQCGIRLQGPPATLHMSHESSRFVPNPIRNTSKGVVGAMHGGAPCSCEHLMLIEGKHFRDYQDQWGEPPRYVVPLANAKDLELHLHRASHYQIAVRAIARSTDERTFIATLLPPGAVCGHSAFVDSNSGAAPLAAPLRILAYFNSFVFDWVSRQFVAANITLFVLRSLPIPSGNQYSAFLSHGALRLTCNHAGYEPLWVEQVGDAWREDGVRGTWPVLAGDDARWAVRSAIDAVVADAYGLTREQYEHVLGTFSHASYPAAPRRCLEAFDKLRSMGLEAFMKKHDPYWDIPLNENPPPPAPKLPPTQLP